MIFVRALLLGFLCCCCIGQAMASFRVVDLPPCERLVTENPSPLEVGVVQPGADSEILGYLLWLTRHQQGLAVCAESWQEVLPLWLPAAPQIEKGVVSKIKIINTISCEPWRENS